MQTEQATPHHVATEAPRAAQDARGRCALCGSRAMRGDTLCIVCRAQAVSREACGLEITHFLFDSGG